MSLPYPKILSYSIIGNPKVQDFPTLARVEIKFHFKKLSPGFLEGYLDSFYIRVADQGNSPNPFITRWSIEISESERVCVNIDTEFVSVPIMPSPSLLKIRHLLPTESLIGLQK
jgi:hypothetical protein